MLILNPDGLIFHHVSSCPYLSPYLHLSFFPAILMYVLSLYFTILLYLVHLFHNVSNFSISIKLSFSITIFPLVHIFSRSKLSFPSLLFVCVSTLIFRPCTAFFLYRDACSSFYLLLLISRHPDILYNISVHPYLSVYLQKISQSPESILT
jgi:hypothetical protein